jgi:hypothetical protein
MTMDEDSLRAALTRIAADPEPPARIDIDAARHLGRRRARVRRAAQVAAGPLAIALAVGIIVTAPHALFARPERAVPSAPAKSSAPTATKPQSAPPKFNPLVPYATFGRLPGGFSEGGVSPLWANPFQSAADSLTLGAQDAAGDTLLLTVYPRDVCRLNASPSGLSGLSTASCVIDTSPKDATRAPDINGRPAWYTDAGTGISWEYLPGAWATLDEAQAGRVPGKGAVPAKPGVFAVSKPALRSVASTVKYGQKTPIVFPFRLSGPKQPGRALPAGWNLTSVSFSLKGKTLVGSAIGAGPLEDGAALSVSAITPDGYVCTFVPGQSSYVTKFGISWIDRGAIEGMATDDEALCSTGAAPAGLVYGRQVFIHLQVIKPGSKLLLAGAKDLGGVFGVYSRMQFLGASPSHWTTNPLG